MAWNGGFAGSRSESHAAKSSNVVHSADGPGLPNVPSGLAEVLHAKLLAPLGVLREVRMRAQEVAVLSDFQGHTEIRCRSLEVLFDSEFSGFNDHKLRRTPISQDRGISDLKPPRLAESSSSR